MKNYHKARTSLKKTKFLSIWAAVFVFAASLVLTGCDKLPGKPSGGEGGGTGLQGAKITIKYNPGDLDIEKWDKTAEKWIDVSSGTEVDKGSRLYFRAKNVPSGKVVDKWTLNGKKELPGGGNRVQYKVNLKDAVDEGGKKVIEVKYSLRKASSITIEYDPADLTVGNIGGEIASGTAIDEGSGLSFAAKVPSGKMVDKWFLNGKELSDDGNSLYYTVKAKDAVEEGGKKVIRITRTLKDAASITIKYNPSEMTIKNINGGTDILSGTAVDEGTPLLFEAKNIPSGKMVEKWLLNGKKEVMPRQVYSVRPHGLRMKKNSRYLKYENIKRIF